MPLPALLTLLGRFAGESVLKSMAARGVGAAAEAGGESAATAARRMTKAEKAVDKFNSLFKDHESHQPPPLPDRRPPWEQAADRVQKDFQKKLDKFKEDPVGHATEGLSKVARDLDSGKSIGQGILDRVKQLDPTGLTGLASAGLDVVTGAQARGLKTAEKVVRDDFVGLLGDVLPDAFQKVVRAADDLTKALVERGRYLARFSGPLSQVSAEADVRTLRREMYEAQQNGRSYSRVIDQQSKLEDSLSRAFMPVRDGIADIVGTALEKLNQLIDMSNLREILALLGEGQHLFAALLSMDPERIGEAIIEMPERIVEALFRKGDQADYDQVIENALAELRGQGMGAAGAGAAAAAAGERRRGDNRFNFPVVRGM